MILSRTEAIYKGHYRELNNGLIAQVYFIALLVFNCALDSDRAHLKPRLCPCTEGFILLK